MRQVNINHAGKYRLEYGNIEIHLSRYITVNVAYWKSEYSVHVQCVYIVHVYTYNTYDTYMYIVHVYLLSISGII